MVVRWLATLLLVACNSPRASSTDAIAPPASGAPSASTSVSPSAATFASAAPSATTDDFYSPVASIDALVARLNAHPMWDNGGFSAITLPESAPVPKIVDRALALQSPDFKTTPPHRILETRKVNIGTDYTACRVQLTNGGRKIVLIRWLGNDPVIGWWSRIFDAT